MGTLSALRFEPALPVWALAALGVVCLLVLALAALRRARGTAWRALALLVLFAWLLGPRLVRETRENLHDIALLVLDETASMTVGDRTAIRDRSRRAIETAVAAIPDLELREVTVPPGRSGTQLFAAIDRALADIPRGRLAGIMALTDGQVHDLPAKPDLPAPLHVLIPAPGEEVDRRLRVVEAPSFGVVGRSVTLKVVVDDLGATTPAPATITLRRDGEPPRTIPATPGREQSLELPITRAGPSVVDLQASPRPGEVSTLNNRTVISINGVRDRLRVLLISGEPHMGERTWRRLLKADPSVDLVHFTILRPPDREDATPMNELALIAFPVRELFQVKINEFDLIILDRFQNRGILPAAYLRNIADYVRNGGGLLMSTGPEFAGAATSLANSPIGTVLPARPAGLVDGPFLPRVTPLGARHPVTENLPGANGANPADTAAWGPWYRRIVPANPEGQPIMAAPDGTPLLLLDHVGQGRTALLLSDQIWLWSRGHGGSLPGGGGPQAELLRRVAHWLMKEPSLDEERLDASIESDTLRIVRRTLSDTPPPPVTVTAPDGTVTRLPLANGGASLPATQPGVWQVTDGVHTAFTAAQDADPKEIADLRATGTILTDATRASGGGVHFVSDGLPTIRRTEPGRDASGRDWMGLVRRRDHLVTGLDSTALLPPWLALPLLLGLALVAWRREGKA